MTGCEKIMRILNLEGEYFVSALKKAGHKVLTIGYSENCDLKLENLLGPRDLIDFLNSKGFVPDVVLWNDLCRLQEWLVLKSCPV